MLYIVATPIGNLDDFSKRAVDTLKNVDLILVEDSRHFSKLAQRYEINTATKSYHEHNEQKRTVEILELLKQGKTVALVSDAGTPTISDPGYRIVKACRDEGIRVSPIPGPSALLAALCCSGFPTNAFTFEGFLPHKPGKRKKMLEQALAREHTSIFYESPHRILKTLEALCELDPTRETFVARELTKTYEETLIGSAENLLAEFKQRKAIRGEFVLIIKGSQLVQVAL